MLNFYNNTSAIIGVIGTLLGVILGYILNALSRIGKIKIYPNKIHINYTDITNMGSRVEVNEVSEKTESINIHLNLDFFNSSESSTKIARNIYFVLKNKKISKRVRLKNLKENYRDLININLSPKELLNFSLIFSSNNNFNEIRNSKFFIEYFNDNNRQVRTELRKIKD